MKGTGGRGERPEKKTTISQKKGRGKIGAIGLHLPKRCTKNHKKVDSKMEKSNA